MQDYLCLGSEARINHPSTLGTNWKWRMKKDAWTDELTDQDTKKHVRYTEGQQNRRYFGNSSAICQKCGYCFESKLAHSIRIFCRMAELLRYFAAPFIFSLYFME